MEEKPKTRRDRYKIEPTQKTRVEKATDEIVKRTLEVLCKEDVFPKRSRWLMAYKIADLINDFHGFVQIANEIEVRSHAEFVERHKYQTLAIAFLKASDVKMTLAVDVMKASANKLESGRGSITIHSASSKAGATKTRRDTPKNMEVSRKTTKLK